MVSKTVSQNCWDGSVMNGTANIQGEQLELTRDGIVAGGFASFMIPPIANSQNGWTATFDLTISDGPGANEPADGMSFNYGNFELTQRGGAEEGIGTEMVKPVAPLTTYRSKSILG